jgi:hypothetical protein
MIVNSTKVQDKDQPNTLRNKSAFNPFLVEPLNLLGTLPKQVCYFSSLSIFCLGSKTISRRAASRMIVLHPK